MIRPPSPMLVIGIGNEFRSDDGVGILVARAIKQKNLSGVVVIEQSGEGAALMDAWSGAENVAVIDAVLSSGTVGNCISNRCQDRATPR